MSSSSDEDELISAKNVRKMQKKTIIKYINESINKAVMDNESYIVYYMEENDYFKIREKLESKGYKVDSCYSSSNDKYQLIISW